jgi:hypothetical protein
MRFVIVRGDDDGVPRNEVSSFIMAKSMWVSSICCATVWDFALQSVS